MSLQFGAISDPHEGEIAHSHDVDSSAHEAALHEVVDLLNDRPRFDIPTGFVPNEREAMRIDRRAQALFYSESGERGLWQNLTEESRAAWHEKALKAVWEDGTLLFGPIYGDDPDGMDEDAVLDRVTEDYLDSVRANGGLGRAESE